MSKIEWLQMPGYGPVTWNPVTGCTKVSAGCKNCWAERMSKRMAGRNGYSGRDPFKVTLHSADMIRRPYTWKAPRMVFVCSMGDLFHKKVTDDFLNDLFNIMEDPDNSHHLFLILTKRPKRMKKYLINRWKSVVPEPANVWIGVSAEDQETLDDRLPDLLSIPAAKRFLSLEPLLGPIHFFEEGTNYKTSLFSGLGYLDWVIVGGESGPRARPMHPDWVRSIHVQCQIIDKPFFFKQWGAWEPSWGGGDHLVYRESGRVIESDHEHPDAWALKVAEPVWKAGKKKAGRKLDGKEYNEFPKIKEDQS